MIGFFFPGPLFQTMGMAPVKSPTDILGSLTSAKRRPAQVNFLRCRDTAGTELEHQIAFPYSPCRVPVLVLLIPSGSTISNTLDRLPVSHDLGRLAGIFLRCPTCLLLYQPVSHQQADLVSRREGATRILSSSRSCRVCRKAQ